MNEEMSTPAEESKETGVAAARMEEQMDTPEVLANQEQAESTEAVAIPVDVPVQTITDAEVEPTEAEPEPVQLNALQEEEAMQAAMQATIHEIIHDDSYFDQLEQSQALELVFLMENLSAHDDLKTCIPRVGKLKKAFEHVYEIALIQLQSIEEAEAKDKQDKILKSIYSRFNTALGKFNKRREAFEQEQEREKLENSKIKEKLLDELKEIVDANDPTLIEKIKSIQERWKATGMVKADDMTRLFQVYRGFLDRFYDLRGKYRHLLEADRQHNLIEKQKLIEEAQRLIPAEELNDRDLWKDKTEELKRLHELWKSIGPVPEEINEELWTRFREVSDAFYASRNRYYEQQDHLRAGNATRKQEILNTLAPFGTFTAEKPADWKLAHDTIQKLQQEWNGIGPASQESNSLMWGQYRTAINSFYERKNNFFTQIDKGRKDNMAAKVALCEEAEKLQDSNDWKKTTDRIKHLQEKWKTVGAVSDRDSQRIWKRFRTACDQFFQRKEHHFAAMVHDFADNLAKKEAICERAEAFLASENKGEHIQDIKDLQIEWNAVGQVPLKEKDKIWNRFRAACDKFFQALGQNKAEYVQIKARMQYENMASRNQDDSHNDPLKYEERKIKDKIKELDNQITQYETNILYISRGKSGDALRIDIQKKIESIKRDKSQLADKLKVLKDVRSEKA
jgi:hypothetical protein